MESEFEFKLRGRMRRASRERVIEALRDVEPEPSTVYMVVVEGTAYPTKQAFSETFGVERPSFGTAAAQRVFGRLGFEVRAGGTRQSKPRADRAPRRTRPIFRRGMGRQDLVQDVLELPVIFLEWSYVWDWEVIANATDDDEEIDLPPKEPGVYEVHGWGGQGCLYIGRASDLGRRVCGGLISGHSPHPAGEKIRENEDLSTLGIRWAVTDRPAAAEEELHRRYKALWGRLPKYVTHT